MTVEQLKITARFPDLAGKVAIVTGASRGIGVGIAEFLGRQGMKLTLAARSEDKGLAVAAHLQGLGYECQWVTADLSTFEGAQKVFDATIARYGTAYLLVNNAAVLWSRSVLDTDAKVYAETFESNVRMMYGLSHLCARHMAERKTGCIVNLSSVGGLRAHWDHVGYDGSKGAIDAMTRSMAIDLGKFGIRVNAIAPGLTVASPDNPRNVQATSDRSKYIPLGRAGTREESGAAIAFLASDAGAYITGQILYIDGGLTSQLAPPGTWI